MSSTWAQRHLYCAKHLAALIACLALGAVVLRPVASTSVPARSFSQAWFESIGGRTVLVSGAPLNLELVPSIDLFAHATQLAVPPGFSVVLPVTDATGYRIASVSGAILPFVAVGTPRQIGRDAVLDGTFQPSQWSELSFLDDVQVPAVAADGRVGWVPWNDASFETDRERLSALATACGVSAQRPVVAAAALSAGAHLTIGNCHLAPSDRWTNTTALAAVAGIDSLSIERDDATPWPTQTSPKHGAGTSILIPLLVWALVVAGGAGWMAALSLSATLAAVSLLGAFEALLLWLLVLLIGAVYLAWRIWRVACVKLGTRWVVTAALDLVPNTAGAINEFARAALKDPRPQLDALAQALQCAAARGARVHFFHDFLVPDLGHGRSAERQQLVEHRKAVVAAGGGQFVDLLPLLRAEASLSWFNDEIHLSTIAHRRVAELMCQQITRARSAAAAGGEIAERE
jgi:hypothetical protein